MLGRAGGLLLQDRAVQLIALDPTTGQQPNANSENEAVLLMLTRYTDLFFVVCPLRCLLLIVVSLAISCPTTRTTTIPAARRRRALRREAERCSERQSGAERSRALRREAERCRERQSDAERCRAMWNNNQKDSTGLRASQIDSKLVWLSAEC